MFLRNRSGKTMLVLLVGCGLVSVALGVGAGLFLGKRAQAADAHGGHPKSGKPKSAEVAAVFSVGEIVVNLADMDTMRYAKASVAFGFQEMLPEEKFKEKEPILKDAVINVLTRKTFKELHRTGGIPMLKKELLTSAVARVPDASISAVYLEGFAMQ